MTRLEHVNITVPDPKATADMLCDLFGWEVRWSGPAKNDGLTYHVGEAESYLALYRGPIGPQDPADSYATRTGLNHIGVVVDDLDGTEEKVRALGYTPTNHGDYEPGRRFYFEDENGLEIEVVSYAAAPVPAE